MKPAKFDYYDPTTLDEALSLLAQFGDRARPLAGGQSLVPLMNFRLIRPAHLIDLNGVAGLSYLKIDDGALRLGATTRQRELERSADVAKRWPLLRDAAGFIGHVQIRNRGTIGGSLAHAFPSAELPVAMVSLDASLTLRSKTNQRTARAEDFFLSYMTTMLQPDELLTEISVPALPAQSGWSYHEVSRRHGDFCSGRRRIPDCSRRKRRHSACPAHAHRRDADSLAGRRRVFARRKAVGNAFSATRRAAPLKTWNRIRIFTRAPNTVAKSARSWRGARSCGQLSGQPNR
jgi:hypothetical protein